MKSKTLPKNLIIVALLLTVSVAIAFSQDRYTQTVLNGLAFSEFRGYESWQLVSISQDGGHVAAILGKPYDDQGVPRRQSRQRQAFARRRQDGENPLGPETDGDVLRSNGARDPTQRRQVWARVPHHREGQRLRFHGVAKR